MLTNYSNPLTSFPGQTDFYKGKVRNIFTIGEIAIAETTDEISAFDCTLPFKVKYKGAVLNLIAAHFLKATQDIIKNCLLDVPTPTTSIWRKTTPFKIEVIVRGYNTGSFYRNYAEQKKKMPWSYAFIPHQWPKNAKFPMQPLVTPTTKGGKGEHDEDISFLDIIKKGLTTKEELEYIYEVAMKLFQRGQQMASEKNLILVDTKYEFGKTTDGSIYLIDEVHTPDSSRYWYKDDYEMAFNEVRDPRALSKEFVRQYLMDHNFKGEEGDVLPEFSKDFIDSITHRYLELYNILTGENLIVEEKTDKEVYELILSSLNEIDI